MTSKAMDARVDRAMQSIASMGGQDATAILGWLRDMLAKNTILHEDVITGRKSTVGETVRSWLAVRKTLPVQQQSVEAFSSISEMRQAMPAENDSILKSERQNLLTDRRKARLEARRLQFDSGAVVDIPLTAFAASIYGRGSKWCTGAISANAFDTYARRSPLFILRTPDNEMFQITVDCDPSEFERILLDNGGMFMREALEQFIFMSMTIKNAQDGDLSEDELNRFMPMANDLFSMIGKSFFAEIKPTWDRYADVVRKEQGDDADEEELNIRESDILEQIMSRMYHFMDMAQIRCEPKGLGSTNGQDSARKAAYKNVFDNISMGNYRSAKSIMRDFRYGTHLEKIIERPSELTASSVYSFLQDVVDGELELLSRHPHGVFFGRDSRPLTLRHDLPVIIHLLGEDCVFDFILKQIRTGTDEAKELIRNIFLREHINGGGRIYHEMIMNDPAKEREYTLSWLLSTPREKDCELLPESIVRQPWFKSNDVASMKAALLIEYFRPKETISSFGQSITKSAFWQITELPDDGWPGQTGFNGVMSSIKDIDPDAVIALLYPEGLTKDGFFDGVDTAVYEYSQTSKHSESEYFECYETIATVLCKIIDKVPMMSGEDRMVAGLFLSAVSKDGIEILERKDQWFAQAIYGRTEDQNESVTFRPIRTFDARDREASYRVLSFLEANSVNEHDRKVLEVSSFLSSVIPYPSDDDLANIETMAAAGVFLEESVRRLCDKGDTQIRNTCDRVRAAVAVATINGYFSDPELMDGMLAVSDGYLRLMAVKKNPTGVERTPLRSPIKREPSESLDFG